MPPSPDTLHLHEYASIEALPDAARALLDGDFFSSAAWYRTVISAGMAEGERPALLVFSEPGGGVAGLFAMRVAAGRACSLTTPYSCLWQPAIAPAADAAAVWRGFAGWCRQFPTVRLEALAAEPADAITAGMARRGMVPLRFDHFGNWHGEAYAGWPAYLAERPGALREAVRRRTKRLMAEGGTFEIQRDAAGIEEGIHAYETVYARSWKTPEPFAAFNATLMRQAAAEGTLRLGLLRLRQEVVAVQIWVVRGHWAAVLKLAHDEAARAHSPGTVLTAMMIRHLIECDGVTALDFGRGDDPYKASWTSARRQRVGLVLANARTPGGAVAVLQHVAGRIKQKAKEQKFFASFFQERSSVLF